MRNVVGGSSLVSAASSTAARRPDFLRDCACVPDDATMRAGIMAHRIEYTIEGCLHATRLVVELVVVGASDVAMTAAVLVNNRPPPDFMISRILPSAEWDPRSMAHVACDLFALSRSIL